MNLASSIDEDIDFAPHTKLGKINPRLDREAATGENPAGFVRFEIIDVRPIPVCFLTDAVSRAVDKVGSVTGLVDDLSGRIIDLETV